MEQNFRKFIEMFLQVPPPHMSPGSEPWVAALLMWLGYSLVVGLVARAIVPLPRPLGTFATILVGLVGATGGPLLKDFLLAPKETSPLRPESFVAAATLAVAILVIIRTVQLRLLHLGRTSSRRTSPARE